MQRLWMAPLMFLRWLDSWPRWLVVAVPCVVAVVVTLLCWDPRVARGGDNALYWTLGRSLAELGEYRDLGAPSEPFETSVPWGYPAVLAAGMRLGLDYVGLKWISWAAMIGGLATLGAFFLRLVPDRRGLVLVALLACAVNNRILIYGSLILSEAPYLLLSGGTLLAYEGFRRRRTWWAVGPAALLAALAYLVRPVGISLVGGVLGVLFLGRRWRALGFALAIVALVDGSWHLRSVLVPSDKANLYLEMLSKQSKFQENDATASLADYAARLVHNAVAYGADPMSQLVLSENLTGHRFVWVSLGVLVLVVAGYVATRSRLGPLHLYLPLYLLALLCWLPESVRTRYLAMVWPLLLVLALVGLWHLLGRSRPHLAALTVFGLAGVLMVSQLHYLHDLVPKYQQVRTKFDEGARHPNRTIAYRSLMDMYRWAADNTPEDAVLGARKPRLAYLYSDRKAVRVTYANEADDVMAWLEETGVDYLLLDHMDKGKLASVQRLAATVNSRPERFTEVYRTRHDDLVLKVHGWD